MAQDTRAAFLRELDQIEPRIARAFEAVFEDITSTAERRRVEGVIRAAMETGNIARGVQEVMDALQIGPDFFGPLEVAIREAFEAGGAYQIGTVPQAVSYLAIRFRAQHPRAVAWSRETAARLVVEITESTRESLRTLMTEAREEGRSYAKTTRDLLGQKARPGVPAKPAMIGLHSGQVKAVANARRQLEALDPEVLKKARLDGNDKRRIRARIRAGIPFTPDEIEKIVGRYSKRLLRLRAETIARTEAGKALNAGRAEGIAQMIESGKVPASAITKIWDSTPGPRTRDSHVALNGMQAAWGEKFVSPVTGNALSWPHDDDAPAEDTVNCRCTSRFRVDWKAVMRERGARERMVA